MKADVRVIGLGLENEYIILVRKMFINETTVSICPWY